MGNPLVDFTNYDAFGGTNCVNLTGVNTIQIEVNNPGTALQDYTFNFVVEDQLGATCNLTGVWSANTTLSSFDFDLTANGCSLEPML